MKYRVKSKEQIVKWLEENGYKERGSHWEHKHFVLFAEPMFDYSGSEPNVDWAWVPDWLEEVEEEKPKLTHEQVFDLWFEIPFINGLCKTWCKVNDFSESTYYFMTIYDGVLEQYESSLEELKKLPHAKIPPRGE